MKKIIIGCAVGGLIGLGVGKLISCLGST